jgi:hypothetical protein
VTALVAAAMVWWLDVYLDERQLTPDWQAQLAAVLREASTLYSVKHHALDVACPVELRPYSITVYRTGYGGWLDGPPPHRGLALAMPFPRTRLYVAPGPGWAIASLSQNWSYTWVGYWTGYPSGTGELLDPWGRTSRGWVVAHELGHAAGLSHREVNRPEDCSLMAYDSMLHADCPANGERLTQADCDRILQRAAERPEPGSGAVQFLMPPAPPIIVP